MLHSPLWNLVCFNSPSPSGLIAAVCVPAWWLNTAVQEQHRSLWGLARYPCHCSLQLLAPDKPRCSGCSDGLGRRLQGSVCHCQMLSRDLPVGIEVEAEGVPHPSSAFPFAKQDVLPHLAKLWLWHSRAATVPLSQLRTRMGV